MSQQKGTDLLPVYALGAEAHLRVITVYPALTVLGQFESSKTFKEEAKKDYPNANAIINYQ